MSDFTDFHTGWTGMSRAAKTCTPTQRPGFKLRVFVDFLCQRMFAPAARRTAA